MSDLGSGDEESSSQKYYEGMEQDSADYDSGHLGPVDQELVTKMLQIQAKRFYFNVKQNRRGRFIKVAEIGFNGKRSKILLALSTAAEFRDHLSTFCDFYSSLGLPNPENVTEDGKLRSEMMVKDNRRYYLDLKENSRGCFLQVSQTITGGAPPLKVAIPAEGMIKFRDVLTDLVEEFSVDEHAKLDLPEGRHVHVDNKNYYFNIGQNNSGVYMRISEVTNIHTAITIPEKSWPSFRDIFIDYCDKIKPGTSAADSSADIASEQPHTMMDEIKQEVIEVNQEEIDIKPEEIIVKDEYISDPDLGFSATSTEDCKSTLYKSESDSYQFLGNSISTDETFYDDSIKTYLACEHCDFKTSYKGSLKLHMLSHSGEKPHHCNQCDFKTKYTQHLKRHLFTHTDEKPHRCHQCDFKTTQNGHLKIHLLKHIGETPYQCTQCDYKTTRKDSLQQHMYKHSDKKRHHCTQCDFQTIYAHHLKRHLLTHTDENPHRCKQCNFKTSLKAYLKAHLLTHSGEKPHGCKLCDFRTSVKRNLRVHMLRHSGEKPHHCKQCDFKTSKKFSLKRHLLRHIDSVILKPDPK